MQIRKWGEKTSPSDLNTFFWHLSHFSDLYVIVCVCACKCRYKPSVVGEDPAVGSRSGEEQLQSCSCGETYQSHESRCSARYVHAQAFLFPFYKPIHGFFLATGPVPRVPNGCTGAVLVSVGSVGTKEGGASSSEQCWLVVQTVHRVIKSTKSKRQKYERPTCHEYHKSLFICSN